MNSTVSNIEADARLVKFKEHFYFKSVGMLANDFEANWLSV